MAQIDSTTYIAARDALSRLILELYTLAKTEHLDPQTQHRLQLLAAHFEPHRVDLACLAQLTDPRTS